MVWTPLILDTYVFDESYLETPESFGDTGGHQSISQHDFPGGIRTQKSYGYFPAAQRWKARSHGMYAASNIDAIMRILAAGREVKLQFGPRSWLGRVAKFSPTVRSEWFYEYEIEFLPRLDYGAPGPGYPPVTDLGTVLALHMLAIQSLLKYGLKASLVLQAVSVAIGGPIGDLLTEVQNDLSAAGGNIGNLTSDNRAAIYQNSLASLAALAPYQASVDPQQSSIAWDAAARVSAIQQIVSAPQPAVATQNTVNPNLVVLAAQYYGDGTQWRKIAAANGMSDPQPIGSYNIVIPHNAA
jgi:hypothetical protein